MHSPDWKTVRDTIDIVAVATDLMGPPPGRSGRGLYWRCPFHDDRNPSLRVFAERGRWKCFGCSSHGDAASLLMRLRNLSFPEAVAALTGGKRGRDDKRGQGLKRGQVSSPEKAPAPTGLSADAALEFFIDAMLRLWKPEGAKALDYLTRTRGLSHPTINRGGLGWTPGVDVTRAGGGTFRASGIVIPWLTGDKLSLLKIRQPDGRHPKYVEAFRDPALVSCYPSPETLRENRPAIVVEGEFDALVLSQALGEAASVVTYGGASCHAEGSRFAPVLSKKDRFLATDADAAGDKAAERWPSSMRRVRPPDGFKDWTEAHQAGVDLASYWRAWLPV